MINEKEATRGRLQEEEEEEEEVMFMQNEMSVMERNETEKWRHFF